MSGRAPTGHGGPCEPGDDRGVDWRRVLYSAVIVSCETFAPETGGTEHLECAKW